MTVLAALVLASVVCICAWSWAVAGLHTGNRAAVVVVLAGAAVAINTLVPVPNVEATSMVVICVAATLGVRCAIAVAVLAVVGSDLTSGIGVWAVWQALGFTLLAAASGLVARLVPLAGEGAARVALATLGALLTVAYDAAITIPSLATTGAVAPAQYSAVLLAGLPFSLVHALATATLLVFAGPSLLRALDRASARLDARVARS